MHGTLSTLTNGLVDMLSPTIKNIYKGLNKDGIFATNIADYKTGQKSHPSLHDWITIERIGSKHVKTLNDA